MLTVDHEVGLHYGMCEQCGGVLCLQFINHKGFLPEYLVCSL